MAPLHRTAVFLWTLLVLALVLVVQAQDPEHTISYFPNDPARLFFFEDKTVCFLGTFLCVAFLIISIGRNIP